MTKAETEPLQHEQERDIAEYLSAVFHIVCGSCGTHKKLMAMDADEASCGFYEDGWRARKDKVVCKRCRRNDK